MESWLAWPVTTKSNAAGSGPDRPDEWCRFVGEAGADAGMRDSFPHLSRSATRAARLRAKPKRCSMKRAPIEGTTAVGAQKVVYSALRVVEGDHLVVESDHPGVVGEHLGVECSHLVVKGKRPGVEDDHPGVYSEHLGVYSEHRGVEGGIMADEPGSELACGAHRQKRGEFCPARSSRIVEKPR